MIHFTDNWSAQAKLVRKMRILNRWRARCAQRYARDNPRSYVGYTERELCWRQKWLETEHQVS